MPKKRGLLLAKMDPPSKGEKEWNDHYSNVHVADRLAIPGFLSARRFTRVDGIPKLYAIPGEPKYMAIYDLESVGVLKGKPYRRVWEKDRTQPAGSFEDEILKLPNFARGVYEHMFPDREYTVPSSKFVLLVGHEVPRGKTNEFNAWYNTEHIPLLLQVPGVVAIRRFVMAAKAFPPLVGRGGVLSKYLTIWDVEDKAAFETREFLKAAASPWSQWVRSWYTRKICALYERTY
ncbi:MAG: hypothetical protein A2147_03895 [Chloroflexi bacterium RBG_16_57_8]|nr:MAG: hypothetical protein A2147_03895 [Chloroflexi bacterium RBG_16_57_8]